MEDVGDHGLVHAVASLQHAFGQIRYRAAVAELKGNGEMDESAKKKRRARGTHGGGTCGLIYAAMTKQHQYQTCTKAHPLMLVNGGAVCLNVRAVSRRSFSRWKTNKDETRRGRSPLLQKNVYVPFQHTWKPSIAIPLGKLQKITR